jgi:tetratricopeptide (TPR) repeat protein
MRFFQYKVLLLLFIFSMTGILYPVGIYGYPADKDTFGIIKSIVPENSWLSAELKLIEAKKTIDYYPEKALKLSLEAEKIGTKYNDIKLIASAKRSIGLCYFNLYQTENAIFYLQNSVKLFENINDKRETNLSKLELGNIIGNSLDYQKGLALIESTLEFFKEEDDVYNLGKAYLYIGDIQKKERIYNYAVESYFKSISYFDKIHLDSDKYYAMNEIASVFKMMKQYKIALKFYNQILDYTVLKNNKNGQGAVLNNIADLYKVLKEYNLALDYFKKAATITKQTGLKYNIAVVNNNLGKTEFQLGNIKNALNYYDEALKLIDSQKNTSLALNLYLNYIEVYLSVNNVKECDFYLGKTKNYIYQVNDNKLIARYYDLLSKTNAFENNFKIAFQNRMIFEKINDSINTENSYEQISDIRIDYETKLKKKENELLLSENTNLKNSKIILIIAIFMIIIVFISIFAVFILRFKNSKQKELIYQQNNELIIKELLLIKDDHEIGQKELVVNVLRDNIAKETIIEIINELKSISLKGNESVKSGIQGIIKKLDKSTVDDTWEKFELHFSKVNERFYSNLLKKHPDLTPGEKRLCALLLINLSSKEIAAITSQTFRSVTTARYRLRQKLNLLHEDNIITYLESLK